jgi:hypothetical protein
MILPINFTNIEGRNSANSTPSFLEKGVEGMILNSFYRATITLLVQFNTGKKHTDQYAS